MFELLLAILVAIGICLWGVFVCQLIDHIKNKKQKGEIEKNPKEKTFFKFLCGTILTLVVLILAVAIITLVKLNGTNFDGMF